MNDKGRGRRKGPLSDKAEVFATRITTKTRRALEASAAKSSRSISQEAELLLVRSLEGSDGSLQHLEAVLDVVLAVGKRLSTAEKGAGTRDSAFVYFGVIKALEWAQQTLPVPKEDKRFMEVVALDEEMERVRQAQEDLKGGRRLDVRSDEERLSDQPSDEMEQLDRELIALLNRRQAALASIKIVRSNADQAARDMIVEIAP